MGSFGCIDPPALPKLAQCGKTGFTFTPMSYISHAVKPNVNLPGVFSHAHPLHLPTGEGTKVQGKKCAGGKGAQTFCAPSPPLGFKD